MIGKPIRTHQNPSKPIKTHQNPSKSIEIHRNPSKSIKTHQNPSKSIKIHQNPSKPIKTHQNPSKSIKIHQNPSENQNGVIFSSNCGLFLSLRGQRDASFVFVLIRHKKTAKNAHWTVAMRPSSRLKWFRNPAQAVWVICNLRLAPRVFFWEISDKLINVRYSNHWVSDTGGRFFDEIDFFMKKNFLLRNESLKEWKSREMSENDSLCNVWALDKRPRRFFFDSSTKPLRKKTTLV